MTPDELASHYFGSTEDAHEGRRQARDRHGRRVRDRRGVGAPLHRGGRRRRDRRSRRGARHGARCRARRLGDSRSTAAPTSRARREVREVVDEIASTFGGIDVLHANAGVARGGSAVEHTEEEWDLVYAVNVKAPWLCAKHAIPHLLDAGGGSIVITGSTSGLLGFPGVIAYTSSKGAVINLTRSLALEHAQQGIRVNCVCPGHIDTPMSRAHFERPGRPVCARGGLRDARRAAAGEPDGDGRGGGGVLRLPRLGRRRLLHRRHLRLRRRLDRPVT